MRADRHDAGRPEAVPVRRHATSTSRPRPRCARPGRELPEACDNTLLIAERCDVQFAEGADLMPQFPVPDGETEESWLVKEVERGLAGRFPDGAVPDAHREQADVRGRRHLPDGLPRLLPGHRRPRAPRQGERHPGRARPRLGGRLARRLRAGHHRARPDPRTACCSSGSSTPSASRCPTSTWTSTSAGAAT